LLIIIHNFKFISFEAPIKLSKSSSIQIFCSYSFQIESEDYLIELISKMIEEDNNRLILLKYRKMDYVSGHLLKKLCENISNDEIDFETENHLRKD
jgi:hypothetical protein